MTVFSSLHPFTIGYDDVFKHFETLLEHQQPNYPPYNIIKTGDYTHCVEVALAGYSKAEVEVIVEDKTLTISYEKDEEESKDVLHRGLAHRSFERSFNLAEDIEVKKATFKNGLLSIVMERIVPDEKKPQKIKISK